MTLSVTTISIPHEPRLDPQGLSPLRAVPTVALVIRYGLIDLILESHGASASPSSAPFLIRLLRQFYGASGISLPNTKLDYVVNATLGIACT